MRIESFNDARHFSEPSVSDGRLSARAKSYRPLNIHNDRRSSASLRKRKARRREFSAVKIRRLSVPRENNSRGYPPPLLAFKRSNTSVPRDEIYASIIYRVPFRRGK